MSAVTKEEKTQKKRKRSESSISGSGAEYADIGVDGVTIKTVTLTALEDRIAMLEKELNEMSDDSDIEEGDADEEDVVRSRYMAPMLKEYELSMTIMYMIGKKAMLLMHPLQEGRKCAVSYVMYVQQQCIT